MKRDNKALFLQSILIALILVFPGIAHAQGDVDPTGTSTCFSLKNNMRRTASDRTAFGEVSKLQDFLNPKYLAYEPTGYFGSATFSAVQQFQKDNDLTPSGYVGPMTRAKIEELTCTETNATTTEETSTINATPTAFVWPAPAHIVYRLNQCPDGTWATTESPCPAEQIQAVPQVVVPTPPETVNVPAPVVSDPDFGTERNRGSFSVTNTGTGTVYLTEAVVSLTLGEGTNIDNPDFFITKITEGEKELHFTIGGGVLNQEFYGTSTLVVLFPGGWAVPLEPGQTKNISVHAILSNKTPTVNWKESGSVHTSVELISVATSTVR